MDRYRKPEQLVDIPSRPGQAAAEAVNVAISVPSLFTALGALYCVIIVAITDPAKALFYFAFGLLMISGCCLYSDRGEVKLLLLAVVRADQGACRRRDKLKPLRMEKGKGNSDGLSD